MQQTKVGILSSIERQWFDKTSVMNGLGVYKMNRKAVVVFVVVY